MSNDDAPTAPYPLCPFPQDRQILMDLAAAVLRVVERVEEIRVGQKGIEVELAGTKEQVRRQNGNVANVMAQQAAIAEARARAEGVEAGQRAAKMAQKERLAAGLAIMRHDLVRWPMLAILGGAGFGAVAELLGRVW